MTIPPRPALTAADLPDPGLVRNDPNLTAANAAGSALQQMRAQQARTPTAPFGGQNVANAATYAAAHSPAANVPPAGSPATAPPVRLALVPGNPDDTKGGAPSLPGAAFPVQPVGSTFQVSVVLQNGTNVASVPLQLQYNPSVLQLVDVEAGQFLQKGQQAGCTCPSR